MTRLCGILFSAKNVDRNTAIFSKIRIAPNHLVVTLIKGKGIQEHDGRAPSLWFSDSLSQFLTSLDN